MPRNALSDNGLPPGVFSQVVIPVKFGARHNMLLFHADDLAQPFLTHNPDLLEMVAPQLEAELSQQLAQKSLQRRSIPVRFRRQKFQGDAPSKFGVFRLIHHTHASAADSAQ